MDTHVCKCCGHPLPQLEVAWYLTRQQTKLLIALKKAGRRGVTLSQLVEELHFDNPEGGPLTGEQSVRVQIAKMKSILEQFSLRIVAERNNLRRLESI